ncbi:MAG: ATP-binding protein [Elusimicrobia bacterium]|nr:ATP-binding protein [Elusimicrobiota bacterium]
MAVLQDWNLWQKPPGAGISRPVYVAKLREFLKANQIVTVTGPRRAGKSYVMRQAARSLVAEGTPPEDILLVNLEDPRLIDLDVKTLDRIFETYREFLAPKGVPFVFLDEVQEVAGWERWVGAMHELGKARLVVSGSNARLLSRELGTLLTGRHLDLRVSTLSFAEFLAFNEAAPADRLDVSARAVELKGFLRRYLEEGAFPQVALAAPKREILLGYLEDIVQKDVIRRFRIRKAEGLKALVKHYLSNPAAHVTFAALGKSFGVSPDSIERFSGHLEQVYAVSLLKRFSYKVREQEKNPRKAYCVDTGLCNAAGFRFSGNLGRLAENAVFLELLRRRLADPCFEAFYWKDERGREVDFVVKEGLKVSSLVQVCWDAEEAGTRQRELRGLVKAMVEFEMKEALLITEDEEAEERVEAGVVRLVPLWKWLLSLAQPGHSAGHLLESEGRRNSGGSVT